MAGKWKMEDQVERAILQRLIRTLGRCLLVVELPNEQNLNK